MRARHACERLQELRPLRQQAVVGRQRLDDHRGDLAPVPREQRLERDLVIERRDQGLLHHVGRQPGAVGQRRLGQTGAGAQQHRVGVAVIAALEFQDLRARLVAARATRSADITASVPELTNRMLCDPGNAAGDQLGELQAVGLGGAEAPAARQGRLGRQRAPRRRRGRGSAARRPCRNRDTRGRRRRAASAPAPPLMKRGVPPTPRKARTGECTPPGETRRARANSSSERAAAGAHADSQSRA